MRVVAIGLASKAHSTFFSNFSGAAEPPSRPFAAVATQASTCRNTHPNSEFRPKWLHQESCQHRLLAFNMFVARSVNAVVQRSRSSLASTCGKWCADAANMQQLLLRLPISLPLSRESSEDVSPIKHSDFPLSCQFSGGYLFELLYDRVFIHYNLDNLIW